MRARLAGVRSFDRQGTTLEEGTVQGGDGLIGSLGHLDKPEAA